MLPLLLALLAPSPALKPIERPVDVECLSLAAARRLEGKTARFRVSLDSPPSWHEGRAIYALRCPVVASLWTTDDDPDDEFIVEARLRVIFHAGDKLHPAFVELRLEAR